MGYKEKIYVILDALNDIQHSTIYFIFSSFKIAVTV